MSDATQGPGWWQAADGKWYPPEQHPDFQTGPPPTEAIPAVVPPPVPPPLGAPGGPGEPPSNARWIVIGVLGVAAIAIAAFLLFGRGDDDKVAANSSSSASSSSTSSSSSRSSSSSSSSSKSSSSSSSAPVVTEADIKSRLIKAKDLGPDFIDETFTPGDSQPTPCGQPSVNSQVPPKIDTGNDASNGVAFFEEEVLIYKSEAEAKKAFNLAQQGVSCPNPTIAGGPPAAFAGPQDVTSDVDNGSDEAVLFDVTTEEAQGKLFVIRSGSGIATFVFSAKQSADTSKLPNELATVKKALQRLAS